MALFNLIARLGLDNSQFRAGLRQAHTEAAAVSSNMTNAFKGIGKGMIGGAIGFTAIQQAINQYKQLGDTVEEVMKKSRDAGRQLTEEQAQDIAFGNQMIKQTAFEVLGRGAPFFRSFGTLAKMAMTPGPVRAYLDMKRDYDPAIQASLERPVAMEAMHKKLEESQESQRKRAEAFAAALSKEIEKRGEDPRKYGLQPSKDTMMDKQVAEYLKRVAENTEALNIGI